MNAKLDAKRMKPIILFLVIVFGSLNASAQSAVEMDVKAIRFAENGAVPTDSADLAISKMVKIMQAMPDTRWEIRGFALVIEHEAEALAAKRAEAVRDALVASGIPSNALTTASEVASAHTPQMSLAELEELRRVEFRSTVQIK